ncbi:hypothetical protein HDV05_000943 [Chytridiales sp. JEL 0842]|nr:hypothetical protein HDV05_000943 [Chytridiales sp. JEL 0842]
MLTYLQVHLFYTLPPLLLLTLLFKPFIHPHHLYSIALLTLIAFIYTTPWDNYIIANGAWGYAEKAVVGVVGWVPIEEYVFFAVMTVLVGLVCVAGLGLGDSDPLKGLVVVVVGVERTRRRWMAVVVHYAVVVLLGLQFLGGVWMTTPQTRTFYLGALLAWTAPPLLLQWSVASTYILHRLPQTMGIILASTSYLCWVDHTAIQAGVWHLNPQSTLGIHVFTPSLPLEEALFFAIVSTIVVFGFLAIERSVWIFNVYNAYVIHHPPTENNAKISKTTRMEMWKVLGRLTFLPLGKELESFIVSHSQVVRLLSKSSKTFAWASRLFPGGVRVDLQILYALFRLVDDIADEPWKVLERRTVDDEDGLETKCKRKKKEEVPPVRAQLGALDALTAFLETAYKGQEGATLALETLQAATLEHDFRFQKWTAPCLLLFGERICKGNLVPLSVVLEVVEGCRMDILRDSRGGGVEKEGSMEWVTEKSVEAYAELVAGSVGEACLRIVLGHYPPVKLDSSLESLVLQARWTGLGLQMVNMARDVETDAKELGRCYAPLEWFEGVVEAGFALLRSLSREGKIMQEEKHVKDERDDAETEPLLLKSRDTRKEKDVDYLDHSTVSAHLLSCPQFPSSIFSPSSSSSSTASATTTATTTAATATCPTHKARDLRDWYLHTHQHPSLSIHLALRFLQLGDAYLSKGSKGSSRLPVECQSGVGGAVGMYVSIGTRIRRNARKGVWVGRVKGGWTGLKGLWGFR